jgi:hypothetical protein
MTSFLPTLAQPRRHGVDSPAGIPRRGDRVDLDQFLIDVEGELLSRRKRLRKRGRGKAKREQCRRRDRAHRHDCDTSIHGCSLKWECAAESAQFVPPRPPRCL